MTYKFSPYLKPLVIITGIISSFSGILVLLGWFFDVQVLKSLNPDYISMKPNTAFCFILTGISILFLHDRGYPVKFRKIARFLLIFIVFITTVTLFEYIFDWDAGIDGLLFKDDSSAVATIFPGRMAWNTIICFMLLSLSLLIMGTKYRWADTVLQISALMAGLISLLPQLGYALNESGLYTFAFKTPMALNTAITFFTISIGVFFIRPASGLLKVMSTEGMGGFFARRMLPVLVILPLFLIWFRLVLKIGGYQFKTIDLAILSGLYLLLFVISHWKTINTLNSIDLKRQLSEAKLILAKEKAEKDENKLEAIINSVSEGISVADMDGNFFIINPAQAKINGFSSVDEMKKGLSYFAEVYELTYLNGQTVPFDQWPISMVLRGELVSDLILNGRRRDTGQEWTFRFSGSPVNDEHGNQILALIVTKDITEYKRKTDNEILAHKILGLLNNNEDSAIMIPKVIETIRENTGIESVAIRLKAGDDFPYYSTSGFNDDFIKTENNLCIYDKNGMVQRDADGNPLLECMCGNILCGRIDTKKSFFTQGGSFRSNHTTKLLETSTDEDRQARTRNRCNSAGYESVALIPIRTEKEIIGLLQLNDRRKNVFNEDLIPFFEGIGTNIAITLMRNKAEYELKKLNEDLEQRVVVRTQQFNDSNKELESFAYSVSHDLRAPLRHIIGFSEILETTLNDKGDTEVNRLTGKIKSAASRMSQLIDELLSYSRIGRTDLNSNIVSFGKIVNDVLHEAQDLSLNRDIEWKISTLPDIKADKTLIHLVFQNLIGNALKFTSKREKAIIEINYNEDGNNEHVVSVKDNGAGFNMDYANKLFGVFQRLHTSEEFEGTGIGLATVRRIVSRHGGKVWAEGKENEGATFYFTIPKN